MTATSTEGPLPPDTETRLASFTELVATAIANAEARETLAQLADEQAALRRVATLVAEGVSQDTLFAAVAEEVAGLVGVDQLTIDRYDDGCLHRHRLVDRPGVSGRQSLAV